MHGNDCSFLLVCGTIDPVTKLELFLNLCSSLQLARIIELAGPASGKRTIYIYEKPGGKKHHAETTIKQATAVIIMAGFNSPVESCT